MIQSRIFLKDGVMLMVRGDTRPETSAGWVVVTADQIQAVVPDGHSKQGRHRDLQELADKKSSKDQVAIPDSEISHIMHTIA